MLEELEELVRLLKIDNSNLPCSREDCGHTARQHRYDGCLPHCRCFRSQTEVITTHHEAN